MDNQREHARIVPGDVISAMGLSFTVWSILYQDQCGGTYDVEFIDDQDRYHHWKQDQDGGTVDLAGIGGVYYRRDGDPDNIAAIRSARTTGYTVRIISRNGNEQYLGRYSSLDQCKKRLAKFGPWVKM